MVLVFKDIIYFKMVHKIALNSHLRFPNFFNSQGAHPTSPAPIERLIKSDLRKNGADIALIY